MGEGILGKLISDIIVMVILIVTGAIIIGLLFFGSRYCVKGYIFKTVIGSKSPGNGLKQNEIVEGKKLLKCQNCNTEPLCCKNCDKEAVNFK